MSKFFGPLSDVFGVAGFISDLMTGKPYILLASVLLISILFLIWYRRYSGSANLIKGQNSSKIIRYTSIIVVFISASGLLSQALTDVGYAVEDGGLLLIENKVAPGDSITYGVKLSFRNGHSFEIKNVEARILSSSVGSVSASEMAGPIINIMKPNEKYEMSGKIHKADRIAFCIKYKRGNGAFTYESFGLYDISSTPGADIDLIVRRALGERRIWFWESRCGLP